MGAQPDPNIEAAPIARAVTEVLGDGLAGLYLYGSAVAGGLRHDSDIDLFAVVESSLGVDVRKALVDTLLRLSGRWPRSGPARPVELTVVVRDEVRPWHFPPRSDFVYGEWLRAEIERGQLPTPTEDPDLTILTTMVRDSSSTLFGPPAADLLDPVPANDLVRAVVAGLPELIAGVRGDERNVVLTLARMWVTAESGVVVSKADAAEALVSRLPAEHAAVLRLARAGYLGEAPDEWTHRGAELDAFVTYAEGQIVYACETSG
ncbi:aminoglycoside adenylyltransferase family protein [Nocardia carnea]|uniref:Aminoglycoside adenylyltransferase family protein n=1 Tax=Nocardia carnea TaxID=37328 RepID=A0ABW7TLT6_9NOCA|nr:aminoglycoside adenylyltransferase family protein [Nocardia carnea]